MAEIDFTFKFSPNTYKDLIQRMAVLYPLTKQAKALTEVPGLTKQVVGMWRARVGALTGVGWEPSRGGETKHAILYARNCCPTFTYTEPRARPCKHSTICPFCYARWVREVWLRLDNAFPAPDPVAQAPGELEVNRELRVIMLDDDPVDTEYHSTTFNYHLIERHVTVYLDVLPSPCPEELTLAANLAELLRNISGARKAAVDLVDPTGAFVYTTIEPNDDGRKWKIHLRQLLRVHADQEIPDEYTSTASKFTRHERPTRKIILGAVARACRYPVGLIRGDAERTALLLDARRQAHHRASAFYGAFRRRR